MDIQATKLDLLQSILSLEKESLLLKIKELIDSEMIVGYTTAGEPLTKYQYNKLLEESEKDMEEGRVFSQKEVERLIKEW
jgi:hypothetical protein